MTSPVAIQEILDDLWEIDRTVESAKRRGLRAVELFEFNQWNVQFKKRGLWDRLYRVFYVVEPEVSEFPKKERLLWEYLSERGFRLTLSLCRYPQRCTDYFYWVAFCDVSGYQTVFE
jgi:hypothetical protein